MDWKISDFSSACSRLAPFHTLSFTDKERNILIVNDEWGTTKGGVSTIHREISCLASDTGIGVYSTVQAAADVDEEDALKKGITLITPTINPKLSPLYKTPHLDWFLLHRSYFPDIGQVEHVKAIIGHVPITNDAAFELATVFPCQQTNRRVDVPAYVHGHHIQMRVGAFSEPTKVYLFNHVIPEDIDAYKDTWNPKQVEEEERKILDAAGRADAVFSVGPRIFNYFENKFRALPKKPRHLQFIPKPEKAFFDVKMKKPSEITTLRVITFGRIKGVARLKGYDLVAAALSKVAETHCRCDHPCPVWVIRGVPEDEHEETKKFLQKYITSGYLDVKLYPYGSQEEIRTDLQQSHLCVMASRTEPFGLVGMEAMAVGLPTLITSRSGLAEFLEAEYPSDAKSVVVDVGINERSKSRDIESWRRAITDVLLKYSDAFELAQRLKPEINKNAAIKKSHNKFEYLCWHTSQR